VRSAIRRFGRERLAVAGVVIVSLILLAALFGPLLYPGSPIAIDHAGTADEPPAATAKPFVYEAG